MQVTRGAQTVKSFTYDNAGNLLTDSVGTAYAYNNRNRMASATIGSIAWNYTYNGKEQLAIRSRVSPAATTHFIHDLWGNLITARRVRAPRCKHPRRRHRQMAGPLHRCHHCHRPWRD